MNLKPSTYFFLLDWAFSKNKISENNNICDVTPSAPRHINFFEPFHFLAGDQLVVPIGASHISLRLQKLQSREWEEREQTNNMPGVNSKCKTRSYVTLCISCVHM